MMHEGAREPLELLVVEDDEVDRMALERLVRGDGLPYRCSIASSLAEARQLLAERPFDVVLTDYHLGDGDGLEVMALARNRPVILITGAGDEELAVRAMRAGAYDYLIKDAEGRYLKMVPVTVDNARRHHASIRRSRMLQQALSSINDSIFLTDAAGRLIFVNATFCATYGYAEAEILGRHHRELWAEGEGHELLPRSPGELPEGGERGECRHRRRDGSELDVLLSRSPIVDGDERVAAVGAARDVTERKEMERQLTRAALYDALTGLPNRALFMDRLDNAVKRHQRRNSHGFGVVFLDLDRFKVINDSLGHLAGDKLLQGIAERITGCLRLGDTVARLGGDEFAILVEDLDEEAEVHRVAERIRRELRRPFTIDGHEFFTAASLGVALSSTGYERPEDLLRDADTAMYRAKAQGRTRQVVFAPDMHARAVALLHLENDLRRAVERRDFEVHYQPIVELRHGWLRGFEALVRWRHPERGIVLPGEFLPLAQETGLLATIGWWVLEQSCRQIAAWQERFPHLADVAISVNLDGQQLSSEELVAQVDRVLGASGLAASSLDLEITEAMIIHDSELTSATLARLRAAGIGLFIDDFGTGYSSLSQLHRFPVDALKIDRAFVSRLGGEGDEIVRTIVSLARNLELRVMAEGIETAEQLFKLRELGCEHGQGFLFAEPLPAAEIEERLVGGGPLVALGERSEEAR